MVDLWQPGMRMTAARLNDASLCGQTIFRATRDTAQTITSTTNPTVGNALSWETIELDDLGGWSAGAPTRYTCAKAGWYTLRGDFSLGGSATGTWRGGAWFINGVLPAGGYGTRIAATPSSATPVIALRSLDVQLAVGDYVEMSPGHDASASLGTSTGGGRPAMTITFGRPV